MLFRYAGGKRKLLKYIEPIMEDLGLLDCNVYIEPFAGSLSVGVSVLKKKDWHISILNDYDYGIYAIWESVKKYKEALSYRISLYKPTVDDFFYFKKKFLTSLSSYNLAEVAFMKIALHQESYSGLGVMAGSPIGGKNQFNEDGTPKKYQVDCRWSPKNMLKHINQIHELIKFDNIHITNKDWRHTLNCVNNYKEPSEVFVYLDPPYWDKGQMLYKHSFVQKDHEELAEYLKTANFKWLLSYDNCQEIRNLYNWATINEIDVKYTINGSLKTNELLIHSNNEFVKRK